MGTVRAGTDDETAGERRQLVNVAYRLLGSVTEAEDAVQDAYARWYGLPRSRQEEILSPGAWLTTVTGRICLDLLGSARARRERYVGAWLPEPLPDRAERDHPDGAGPTGPADPADQIVLDESVAMAFLVVLESMTPAERVAFVLHDVFRYPFAEIADVLGRTPAASKQLAASARRRVGDAHAPVTATGRVDVVRRVKVAWETRDIPALVSLLDPAAVMTADGGGMVGTVLRPVEGGARIAEYMVAIADRAPGLELLERSVNGVPGLVARHTGVVMTVASFDISEGRVTRIWAVRNPEKLRPWGREGQGVL
ncbi:RNA polymerase sigma factor SigJ [Streptomyces europaeiscabiei]|uniref:RNA polymerase sigma factor SigJ n=2 Tax=Streptomyces europaeiscabiei TaxID=146819 RepID=A0ABU4NLD6_9ACTN|nr:RNA polymerase sigma factor SigJ [Streptomyces europaeiscabiei]MDX3545858.1 RNA polymerase sigma factor SigJ [Streptomyces europaeiscabiei]MDX3555547.1 RNA polymerase sigma factor SigJ [Streptomyces europaeiscabiei]MDX3667106.1 RNA polymerase sigma factor SigJ [Streptomyces europaeiscabiei]MDX3703139.1 RNA polymerase sigma factor SigJ [Streptomyces europaeiscabiei]MDX3835059.1 RNA polymerase sigma factor SigJ [Streptomyces europaeiscabiei]